MIIELVSGSPEDTYEIARSLGEILVDGDVIALTGDLGAGKTCFSKGIGAALGISPDRVASPTFVISTKHEGDIPLTHVDVYRLESARDAIEIGLDEIFYDEKGVCVVEWAEKVEDLLPTDSIRVTFGITGENSRKITVSSPEQGRLALFREQTACFRPRG